MLRDEFKNELRRLVDFFGERAYLLERVNKVWEYVEHLPVKYFEKIVTNFIAELERPPMPLKFFEATTSFRTQIDEEKQRQVQNLVANCAPCGKCQNSGIVYVKEKKTTYTAIFNCYCDIAKLVGRNFSTWSESYLNKYDLASPCL